jgi:hypothetical protein
MEGCVTCSLSPAREKLFWRATSRKVFNQSKSIFTLYKQQQKRLASQQISLGSAKGMSGSKPLALSRYVVMHFISGSS